MNTINPANEADRQKMIKITTKRTWELTDALGITDQLDCLSCAEAMEDVALRISRLKTNPKARQMSQIAMTLANTARELGI